MPVATPLELSFFVAGRPVSQGNLSRSSSGHTYDATKGLDVWRKSVEVIARKSVMAAGWPCTDGPVELVLHFELARPRSVDRLWPCVRPDLDKLCRAIGDALTGVVYVDDAQVCALASTKSYAAEDAEPGVMVTVRAIL